MKSLQPIVSPNKEELYSLISFLETFLTDERKNIINKNIQYRTRYLTVVLEDIFQPQNASAVLRTCDCFGIQNLHIIENRNKYHINPDVALGSAQWLTLTKYNSEKEKTNTPIAISKLKEQGYRIVATSPHVENNSLSQLDLSKGKIALVFGTERTGISEDVSKVADEWIKIPMVGFAESLNISNSAAIILQHLSESLRKSDIQWQLNEMEFLNVKLDWVRKSLKKVALLEKEFYKRTQSMI